MSGDSLRCVLAGAVLGSLVPLAGCNLPLATATATDSERFETGASPTIVVETFNGSIDLSDGENDEVVVEVTKRAGGPDQEEAERNLDDIEVSIIQKNDTITVAARPLRRHGNSGVSVVIAAPKMARLKLKSSNGPIVCEGLAGGIDATTSNGRLDISGAGGTIDAKTSNGSIEIEAADAVVDARTSNGRIGFQGSLAEKDQRFRSSNGSIDIVLPSDSKFRLDSSTSNAGISCKFPIDQESGRRRTRLKGTVGENPGTTLVATTSNAHIDICPAAAEAD